METLPPCPRCGSAEWKEIPFTESFVCACGVVNRRNDADKGIIREFFRSGDIPPMFTINVDANNLPDIEDLFNV